MIAGFLGWTLDAFDFFIVVVTLTAIGKEFHVSDAEMAKTLAVTLAFRPIGALIFGVLADRYGRRIPLMINLVFYSALEVASGLATSYTMFFWLRALFGIGMGGEWGVGATLVMEKAPVKLRGMLSGLLQEGYAAGNLLASIAYFLIFPHWGWRPLFFIGGLPALLAIFVRMRVKESEVWQRTRHHDFTSLFRAIVSQWRLFLYLTLLMALMNGVSHGTQDLYPTFLQRDWGMSPHMRSAINAVGAVGAIVGGIAFGFLSDRIGRRRSIVLALLARRAHDSVVGLRAEYGAARRGRVRDAVHGAGRVGRDPGAHHGARPGFRARIHARFRVSVRCADRRVGAVHPGRAGRAHVVRESDDRQRPDGIRPRRRRCRTRPGEARGNLRGDAGAGLAPAIRGAAALAIPLGWTCIYTRFSDRSPAGRHDPLRAFPVCAEAERCVP